MLDKSPNLIFVFADQLRARHMGCSGDPNIATPNLDRMATEGVRFTNATSMIPVCTPARAALLTGRYPLSTGMFLNDIQMSTEETTTRMRWGTLVTIQLMSANGTWTGADASALRRRDRGGRALTIGMRLIATTTTI